MAYIGIDLGTSGLRALLVDDHGVSIGSAEAHYAVQNPHVGWSEQDPASWISALHLAMSELRQKFPEFSRVRGIGVAGHMHGAVLLDADWAVLRPCILWNDTRSHQEADMLDAIPDFRAKSGNIVFAGFTAPKLEWVRRNEPQIFEKTAMVLLPAAYLNLYLTGQAVGDVSDAAGTAWLDTGAREWSQALLCLGNMEQSQMARLVEGCAPAGTLRAALGDEWGLGADVIVAGGAADNAAAACGMGVMRAGQGFVSLGTSGVVLAASDAYTPNAASAVHTFCHAVPDQWYQMGVMLAATDSLNWLSQITGLSPSDLVDELGTTPDGPSGLVFVPYLSGERTPHNDTAIRGGFAGLSKSTTRANMTQAVLEGVCFGLRDCLEAIRESGTVPTTLYAIGGGSASEYWLRLLASVLNISLLRPAGGEFGAALGAARLGMIAATGCAPETVMTSPECCETFVPDAALVAAYQPAFERYRSAYSKFAAI